MSARPPGDALQGLLSELGEIKGQLSMIVPKLEHVVTREECTARHKKNGNGKDKGIASGLDAKLVGVIVVLAALLNKLLDFVLKHIA